MQLKYNQNYKQIYINKDEIQNQTTTRLEQKIKRAGINANLSILIT